MAVRQRPARGAPGQHFLRSSRLASSLVQEAGVGPGDLVVDIGAGTGVLTNALAEAGTRVIAIELDPSLVSHLRRRFGPRANVTVLETDVLRWSWPDEPFAVVSNLPFTGSAPILDRLLDDPGRPLRRADVIVQWEVAVKLAAVWPATLKGTLWRAWYELTATARLARTAFSPPPNVDAGVLRVLRRPRPLVAAEDRRRYRRFVADSFRIQAPLQRALRPCLSSRELRRLAPVLGFTPDALARDLDASQWAGLFDFVKARSRA